MPHAALWVVQQECDKILRMKRYLFQCRTRLCGWCSSRTWVASLRISKFQCRTRLCGWCSGSGRTFSDFDIRFQCRTRLCGWCSRTISCHIFFTLRRFNAARGFVGGAASNGEQNSWSINVSMPHAALWVVQQRNDHRRSVLERFQCRTRLCGWCSQYDFQYKRLSMCFNAARGFVGGAAKRRSMASSPGSKFQCRTRLCGWCSGSVKISAALCVSSFNAARGFVGGAAPRPTAKAN